MEKQRNPNIDLLKGILILLVILGHVILGSVNGTFARYVIYSFHMPIFIGLSGFLLVEKKLKTYSFSQLIEKYWLRVFIPFLIGVNVYFLFLNYNNIFFNRIIIIENYLHSFIYPYYHLWFIPAFLLYIFITWLLLKGKLKIWQILLFALCISLASKYRLFRSNKTFITQVLDYIHYDFRLYLYVFFVLGIFLQQLIYIGFLVSLITLILYFLDFYIYIPFANVFLFVANFSLLSTLLHLIINQKLPRNKILEFIGRNSLTFYLYHVLGKIITIKLIGTENTILYYVLNFIMILILGITIYYFKEKKIINKFLKKI
jgi:fucose 4-O-acetylase-like acetyltransferase